jgi:ankyrin repeat protein
MLCRCRISYGPNAGNQCSYKAQPDKNFCGVHLHCDRSNIIQFHIERSESSQMRINRPSNTSRTGRLKRDNYAIRQNKMNSNMPPIENEVVYVKGKTIERHQYRVYNIKSENKMSILVWDLMYNNGARVVDIVRLHPNLLDKKSSLSTTPLLAAVNTGNIKAVRFLISRGADVRHVGTIYDIKKVTPMGLAAIVGNLDIYNYLLNEVVTLEDARVSLIDYLHETSRSMMSWDTVLASVPSHVAFSNMEVLKIIEGLRTNSDIPYLEIIAHKYPNIFNRHVPKSICTIDSDVERLLKYLNLRWIDK